MIITTKVIPTYDPPVVEVTRATGATRVTPALVATVLSVPISREEPIGVTLDPRQPRPTAWTIRNLPTGRNLLLLDPEVPELDEALEDEMRPIPIWMHR